MILAATFLLIHDVLEAIQYSQDILDFIMLAHYVFHNKKTLRYIEHALYRLENIKITFEHYRPINSKLC